MKYPNYQHSGKVPHLWKIRRDGFNEFVKAKGWKLRSVFAEKQIGNVTYIQMVQEFNDDFFVVLFVRMLDFKAYLWQRDSGLPN